MKAARMTDAELLEAIELAAARARTPAAEDLRRIVDVLAGLGLEAASRIRARGRDELRERASRLEDAAFHFQTCSLCRREGDGACTSGSWFAGYLRGEYDEEGAPPTPAAAAGPGGMLGKVRGVVLHADGRLTGTIEISGARRAFVEQITSGRDLTAAPEGDRNAG